MRLATPDAPRMHQGCSSTSSCSRSCFGNQIHTSCTSESLPICWIHIFKTLILSYPSHQSHVGLLAWGGFPDAQLLWGLSKADSSSFPTQIRKMEMVVSKLIKYLSSASNTKRETSMDRSLWLVQKKSLIKYTHIIHYTPYSHIITWIRCSYKTGKERWKIKHKKNQNCRWVLFFSFL